MREAAKAHQCEAPAKINRAASGDIDPTTAPETPTAANSAGSSETAAWITGAIADPPGISGRATEATRCTTVAISCTVEAAGAVVDGCEAVCLLTSWRISAGCGRWGENFWL